MTDEKTTDMHIDMQNTETDVQKPPIPTPRTTPTPTLRPFVAGDEYFVGVSEQAITQLSNSDISDVFYQFDENGLLQLVQPPSVQSAQVAQVKRKKWWQSRTLWFNGLSTAVAVASTLTPALQPFMTPTAFATYVAVTGAVNKLLRFDTHQAIVTGKQQGGSS